MDIIYLDKPSYLPASAIDRLSKLGNFKVYEDLPNEQLAVQRLSNTDIAIVEWTAINSSMLDKIRRLKCAILVTTSYDRIDIGAAEAKGIVVCNTPYYSSQSVAEHIFALILQLSKGLCEADALVREHPGKADFTYHRIGFELYGKTLGIWGLGNIGAWVSKIGKGFGMRVIGSSRTAKHLPSVEELPIGEVLSESDILCICVTKNPSTTGFLNKERIGQMKRGALLINTTGNSVLDEQAVSDALNEHHLSGAAFDSTPSPVSPLLSTRNAFFTPGIAWYTQDSLDRNVDMFVESARLFIEGKPRFVVSQ